MSIPIERRELEGGWVLTCRGKQGGDLRLSDISMDRENLLCYVLGSDENVLQPLANTLPRAAPVSLSTSFETDTDVSVDDSILEEVRELQKEGVKIALSGDGRYDSPGKQIGSFILSDVIF